MMKMGELVGYYLLVVCLYSLNSTTKLDYCESG